MNAGKLVPDEVVIGIIKNRITQQDCEKGFILDGFPRTVKQAESFREDLDFVIYLKVSDKEALNRIAGRKDENRKDETPEAIKIGRAHV